MVGAWLVVLGVLACERLFELGLSRRNARRMLARGGVESGRGHLPWMILLHAAFLAGCAVEVIVLERPFSAPLAVSMLVVAGLAQALRYWTIHTLGDRWSIRVIVEPGRPLVTGGPFRYLRHPNYLAVALEGVVIPLAHGAWITAAAFTCLNAWLLVRHRIPEEERALAAASGSLRHARRRFQARGRGA